MCPSLQDECVLNYRGTNYSPGSLVQKEPLHMDKDGMERVRGLRGGETKLWKEIEAEVESEEENWAASHRASLWGQQGPEEEEGL